ncbi:antibiotic biosynthesis monooxygenase family protein [Streptomyces sp. NPDC048270]|uniref:antibiotic biosynthesis monooxygenase family protein n=1 Tax=Streptomyces sp. NPDC048270 TaxID=3154615 RepID=UPI0034067494
MTTFINKLTVQGDVNEFLAAKEPITAFMSSRPGHIGNRTLRNLNEPGVFVEVAHWDDQAAHQAAVGSAEFRSLVAPLAALATPEPGLYEVVEAGARLQEDGTYA